MAQGQAAPSGKGCAQPPRFGRNEFGLRSGSHLVRGRGVRGTSRSDPRGPEDAGLTIRCAEPEGRPALARLTYLLGDWTVTSFERTKGGEFIANPAVSFFRARYLRDGLSLMAEFFEERTISATSFVKRIYQSDDEGKTWKQGDYYFRYTRVR